MKLKSKNCFQDLHFILSDKKFDGERFLEKIIWSLLPNFKRTNTLAETNEGSLNSMHFNKKNSIRQSKNLVLFRFNFFQLEHYRVFA